MPSPAATVPANPTKLVLISGISVLVNEGLGKKWVGLLLW